MFLVQVDEDSKVALIDKVDKIDPGKGNYQPVTPGLKKFYICKGEICVSLSSCQAVISKEILITSLNKMQKECAMFVFLEFSLYIPSSFEKDRIRIGGERKLA